MPNWNQLIDKLERLPNNEARPQFIRSESLKRLREIGKLRGNRHVIFYGSAFLQKPQAPPDRLQITHEDVNAFMSVMYGMTWTKNLTLLLHTPGGVTNAAETIVAYLRWVRLFFVERFPPCSWAFRSRALSWVRRTGGQHSPPPVFGPPEQAARLDHDAWALRSAPPAHPPGHSRGVLVRFDGKGDASAMAVVTTRFSGRAKQRLPEC